MPVSDDFIISFRSSLFKTFKGLLKSGKPILLHGNPGVGKSAFIVAALNKLGYIIQTINASQRVTKNMLPSSFNDFDGNRIALVVNEADRSLKETFDIFTTNMIICIKDEKGNVIDSRTRIPLIFTCNDVKKFGINETLVKRIVIKPLNRESIEAIIREISNDKLTSEQYYSISLKCNGDLRAAIKALEFPDGMIDKRVPSKTEFFKRFLRFDAESAVNYLKEMKVGEYNGFVGMEWLISVIARNIDGDDRISKLEALKFVSENKYLLDRDVLFNVLSCCCDTMVQKINYPGGNKFDKSKASNSRIH